MKKVTLHLINTCNAYNADECGNRWFTEIPQDTEYYKHQRLETREIELPEGVWYDESVRTFFDENGDLELVTEKDMTCKLISSERIIVLFRGNEKTFDSVNDCLCYLAEEGYLCGGDSIELIGRESDPDVVCEVKIFGYHHSPLASYYILL